MYCNLPIILQPFLMNWKSLSVRKQKLWKTRMQKKLPREYWMALQMWTP